MKLKQIVHEPIKSRQKSKWANEMVAKCAHFEEFYWAMLEKLTPGDLQDLLVDIPFSQASKV